MTLATEHTQEETEQGIPEGTNIINLFFRNLPMFGIS
jgi:hypothetical protein